MLACQLAVAQTQDEQDYLDEYNFGFNFNTNGGLLGGLMGKYGWFARKNQYNSVGLELVNLVHPKEITVASGLTNNTFVPYKLNYVVNLRTTFNREFVLFRKGVEEGVHVNAIIGAGPTLAFVKPYYILYDPTGRNSANARSVPYDPRVHDITRILGRGNLFDGLDLMQYIPGVNIKGGFSFEFGRFNGSLIGVETGINLDYYTRALPIMTSSTDNYALWTGLYLNLYYGRKSP